ncbi:protein-glutamine gamma-glutamyltransferase K-like [Clarias gariepinus]
MTGYTSIPLSRRMFLDTRGNAFGYPPGSKIPAPSVGHLSVDSIDLLKSKTGQNRREHHTDRYQSDNFIIRRGQGFQIRLEFSRVFDPKADKLHLQLYLGPKPSISKGTLVTVSLVEKLQNNCWEAKIINQKDQGITLWVNTPPTAPIGRYGLSVITWTPQASTTFSWKSENDIYLLFNPWCKDDTVFLDNKEQRMEYVLNEYGTLYCGTKNQIGSRPWIFGQFADGVLAACLFILEKSQTLASGWGDPVTISRLVSAMVNAPDDQGVLVGNWSTVYENGTAPTLWHGSVEILRQYHTSGGNPVKYGQCWVFSGVTTTILRCLGIPTRSVTNFDSAHDTDVSMTIDVYVDEKMRPIENLNTDSVWNFHLWNECWMARPDLPVGMGGWQVVDATPQETSQGMFRCGPTPVAAVLDGLVYTKFDTHFVFPEVNSDRIYWQKQPGGNFSQIGIDKNVVGHCISTKAVGCDKREDITHLYKYPKGSERVRIALETASKYGSKPNVYASALVNDVTLKVAIKGEEPFIGQDACLALTVKNKSYENRSGSLFCHVAVMNYTGVIKGKVKEEEIVVKLKPTEVKTLDWTIPYAKYKDLLVDHAAMLLTVTGRVRETQQVLATRFNFHLRSPNITITPVGDAVLGKEMAANITFKNPLPCVLKNVKFHIEGLGLMKAKDVCYGDVASLTTVTLNEKFTPTLAGPQKLLASLDCQQLTHVYGVAEILIKEK